MVEQKRKDPPNGEFIDLEKTEFKKKNNFLGFLIKYTLVGIIFFGIGFLVNQKYKIPIDIGYRNNSLEPNFKDEYFLQFESTLNSLKNEIEKISEKIKSSNLSYENLEKKNRQLLMKLDEIDKRILKANEFDYTSSFRNELSQYELLKTFIILKKKFDNRQDIKSEISVISNFLEKNFEVLTILNFFNETDLTSIVTKDYLLNEVNKKIKKYDLQLEDYFEDPKSKDNLKKGNILDSKEQFFKYINDIFSSTFKVTKYKDENFEENIQKNGTYIEVLILSKEYLIIGNITRAVKLIEKSGIDLVDFNQWIEKGNQLIKAQNNIVNLENLIFKKLVNYND